MRAFSGLTTQGLLSSTAKMSRDALNGQPKFHPNKMPSSLKGFCVKLHGGKSPQITLQFSAEVRKEKKGSAISIPNLNGRYSRCFDFENKGAFHTWC
jgi:hypothetical protein